MANICSAMRTIRLRTVYRTRDPELLSFLSECRVEQPKKQALLEFFAGRTMGPNLDAAVRAGLDYGRRRGVSFSWLCVTNAGADRVNCAALRLLGIHDQDENLLFGDPKVNAGRINVSIGVMLRLTRNLDKGRGFVNGAIGEVFAILDDYVFILRLSSGTLVLVHPIRVGGRTVLPCSYGYATTIRKSQGASLSARCLYFDHRYPAERGYGYVGASRFMTKSGLFYYGCVRRSDWLPRTIKDGQQASRTIDSESDDEQDAEMDAEYEREMEAEYESGESDDSMDGELGRLCRAAGTQDAAIPEAFDSDDDDYGLHAIACAGAGASTLDDQRGLRRL